jgi:hypothetical protein
METFFAKREGMPLPSLTAPAAPLPAPRVDPVAAVPPARALAEAGQ